MRRRVIWRTATGLDMNLAAFSLSNAELIRVTLVSKQRHLVSLATSGSWWNFLVLLVPIAAQGIASNATKVS